VNHLSIEYETNEDALIFFFVVVALDALWVDGFKGIVHLEFIFWYVSAYLKGIQDVGVFVSAVV